MFFFFLSTVIINILCLTRIFTKKERTRVWYLFIVIFITIGVTRYNKMSTKLKIGCRTSTQTHTHANTNKDFFPKKKKENKKRLTTNTKT